MFLETDPIRITRDLTLSFRFDPTTGLEVNWTPSQPRRVSPELYALYSRHRRAFLQKVANTTGQPLVIADGPNLETIKPETSQ